MRPPPCILSEKAAALLNVQNIVDDFIANTITESIVCMQHEQTDVEFCAGTLPRSRLLSITQLCIAAKIVLC